MIDPSVFERDLQDVLRWQLANPGRDDGPEVPWGAARVWGLFLRLHEARGAGGFGPAPITLSDMDAFQRLSGELLRPWEVEIIRTLDREVLTWAARKNDAGNATSEVSSRPMSPALFDAVFGK